MQESDIRDLYSNISGIFWYRDRTCLDTNQPAKKVIGRVHETTELVKCLAASSSNFIIVRGRSGTGKTTVVRQVCQSLPDTASAIVNFRQSNTVFGCMNLVLRTLGLAELKSPQGMNKAIASLSEGIEKRLVESGAKRFVLVLDDFDAALHCARDPSTFVNELLAMVEDLRRKGCNASLVAIMNDDVKNLDLDERIVSRISSAVVNFAAYSPQEIRAILEDRANDAFISVPPPHILDYCIRCCGEYGDARRAIDLLRTSSEYAYCEHKVQIAHDHVSKAAVKNTEDSCQSTIQLLQPHQQAIVAAIARRTKLTGEKWHSTADLYAEYKRIVPSVSQLDPLQYRRFLDLLEQLQHKKVADYRNERRGRRGNTLQHCLLLPLEIAGQMTLKDKWWEIIKAKQELEYARDMCNLADTLMPESKQMLKPIFDGKKISAENNPALRVENATEEKGTG